MTRAKWRTPLGVALGVIASEVLWLITPSATFPRAPIGQSLMAVGLGIPDWAFNVMEYIFVTAAPVGPAVACGALLCVLVAGAGTIRRGVNLGIVVACVDVGIPLAVMIFVVAFRGLSFPWDAWAVKVLIQPITAVVVGALVGGAVASTLRLAAATHRRASSSL
jgi:hypothetical protein